MGQEINKRYFNKRDFDNFSKKLGIETELLKQWFEEKRFDGCQFVAGLELEAWLVDKDFKPAAINERFFKTVKSKYLTPELAKFNIELNVDAIPLSAGVLSAFKKSIEQHWAECRQAAQSLGAEVMAIGILPTLTATDMTIQNMSKMARYEALNEQVLLRRKGKPIKLHIIGKENIQAEHYDVMLEAAATSLQIHIQIPQEKAVSYYNASVFISAFTVAASANSPFLFGKNLWEESRIPLFEQAVESGGFDAASAGPLHRVSFGSGYCRQSLLECFDENQQHFPVLLPMSFASDTESMEYVRLHNGTIWRWNRPLIGFNSDGQPHLRIEHRVIPAGPTLIDQLANIALYYGLVHYFAELQKMNEQLTDFSTAKDNFYKAARHGLNASVKWLDGENHVIQTLFLEKLIDFARQGLKKLVIDDSDSEFYLDIIKQRVETGRTGSYWQQQFVKQHGHDMSLLSKQYFINQNSGRPVHEWGWEVTSV